MSRRNPFCRCFERERKGKKGFDFEEIRLDTVLFAREGSYTIKKMVRRFWEPSLKDVLSPGEARHICRRVFWCHIGLSPYWFFTEGDRVPEFIQRKGEIVAQDLSTGPPLDPSRRTGYCRAEVRGSPVFSWEQEKIKLAKLLVQVEQDMCRKLSELMVRSPANWDQERIKLAKRLIDLELDMSRKLSQLMVSSIL